MNGAVCRDFNAAIDPDFDELTVDGQPLSFKAYTYVMLNKPPGVVTTMSDEQGRETVVDLLPENLQHLRPVGRLDMYSEGLLILTNDGELALRLTHPRHHLPKLYWVKLRGNLTERARRQLERGIVLDDGITLPAKVVVIERNRSYTEVNITLVEGRNRQIRRMFDYVRHPVVRLVRLAIGGLQLGNTDSGTWRYLTSQEVSTLISQSTD